MRKCINCGHDINAGDKFCLNCGQSIEPAQEEKVTSHTRQPASAPNARSLSKKKKVGIISAVVCIAILIGAHFVVKSILDPNKTIESMHSAFMEHRYQDFIGEFVFEDNVESNPKGFYQYIGSQGWSNIRSELQSDVEKLKNNEMVDPITDDDDNQIITLIEKPILGGLYTKVEFKISPIHVYISSDLDDIELKIKKNKATSKANKKVELGSYLPGSYKWDATINNEYGTVNSSGSIKIEDAENNKFIFEPKIDVSMVSISADESDAIVYVNGKSTNKTVDSIGEIGPMPLDGSVSIYALGKDNNNKKVKSTVIKVESDEIYLPFAHVQAAIKEQAKQQALGDATDENYDDLVNFYHNFRTDFEDDLNNKEYDLIDSYLKPGSALKTEFQKYINKFKDTDYFDFKTDSIEDVKAITTTKFLVTSIEDYEFEGDTKRYYYSNRKYYTITYQNGEYLIDNIDTEKLNEWDEDL